MDKDIHTHTMESYSAVRTNAVTPFAATWMDLEIITLNEVRQRQILYYTTYMWSLKNNTNELICKTGKYSQTQKTNLRLPKGKGGGRGGSN